MSKSGEVLCFFGWDVWACSFLMKSLEADIRLWAISGSQDLVQTAHLAACDLGRDSGHSAQNLGLPVAGPELVCSKAARWCRFQRGPQVDT